MKADQGTGVEQRLIVVDTNVWICAMLARDGSPTILVRAILERGLPVFTPATFSELETRLWKPKFDRYIGMDLRMSVLHDLGALAQWIDVDSDIAGLSLCRDPDDDKFLHAAMGARAPWLVTGDRDLLDVAPIDGLDILTPQAALHEIPWLVDR